MNSYFVMEAPANPIKNSFSAVPQNFSAATGGRATHSRQYCRGKRGFSIPVFTRWFN
jgi:hypothetical protein